MCRLIRLEHILKVRWDIKSCVSRAVQLASISSESLVSQQLLYRAEEQRCVPLESITHWPDSRRYRAQSLSWFMFPAVFLHLCLNLSSTLQSGLRMQSMMGCHLVGIVSDRTEGCAGLLKEKLRLYFLCRQRRLAALSKPDKCWVKCCITVCAEDFMHTASF